MSSTSIAKFVAGLEIQFGSLSFRADDTGDLKLVEEAPEEQAQDQAEVAVQISFRLPADWQERAAKELARQAEEWTTIGKKKAGKRVTE